MINLIRSNFQDHPYHLVTPSPWPLFTSFCLLILTTSGVLSLHNFNYSYNLNDLAFLLLVSVMSFWFRDIIIEATYLGDHTLAVQKGISLGLILFIISEALFFVAIFWAFFHSALTPTVELGGQWPPVGVELVNPFELPLLNTVLLLSSGSLVTLSHHGWIKGDRIGSLNSSVVKVLLALIFTLFQFVEYSVSSFTISDGAFGSVFYFGTGFHGVHVIVGTLFLNFIGCVLAAMLIIVTGIVVYYIQKNAIFIIIGKKALNLLSTTINIITKIKPNWGLLFQKVFIFSLDNRIDLRIIGSGIIKIWLLFIHMISPIISIYVSFWLLTIIFIFFIFAKKSQTL